MSFFGEYIKHPRTVGAVAPSGKYLMNKMVEKIPFEACNIIVEYGPGTGVFTREVIRRKRNDTFFIIIEQNKNLYLGISKQFKGCKNVIVCNDTAANVNTILQNYGFDHADYIISGLPFASLPKDVCESIMEQTSQAIGRNGIFTTFQYTMFKKAFFEYYLRIIDVTFTWKNLPPAYVLHMKNK